MQKNLSFGMLAERELKVGRNFREAVFGVEPEYDMDGIAGFGSCCGLEIFAEGHGVGSIALG